MPSRSQHIAVASFLTIATFAITSGIQRSPGIPAQLSDDHINIFSPEEAAKGITLQADEHNIFSCPAGTNSEIASAALQSTAIRFWVYQYSNQEPTRVGEFYISPGELAVHPQYAAVNRLRSIAGGKRYYVMSSVTLQFTCNNGLDKTAVCGNGILEGSKLCDVVHEGCNQQTCTPMSGYVCESNICRVYIPTLGDDDDVLHTECRNNTCTSVRGPGANQCMRQSDCAGSSSSNDGNQEGSLSVQNANPNVDYSAIPTGINPVGQFKFTAKNGYARLDALIFTVHVKNAAISTGDNIHFFNKADPTLQKRCTALYPDGSPYTAASISGKFLVVCEGLHTSDVNTAIDAGTFQTFVLALNVVNPLLNASTHSELQVSLENINMQTTTFGVGENMSHVRWLNGSTQNLRLSNTSSNVKSTFYVFE